MIPRNDISLHKFKCMSDMGFCIYIGNSSCDIKFCHNVFVNCSTNYYLLPLLETNISSEKKSARRRIRKNGWVRCVRRKSKYVMTSPAINAPCALLLKMYDASEKKNIAIRRKKRMS